ncbi:MAG TPA: DinB family protein [Chitinophagaceae bacterium]|jgi:DinB family protein|nr:DinB family protein [Chitinophagaceae bacterium]
MKEIASKLNKIIDDHLPALRSASHEEFHFKPSPAKWSKKEILGHLVDSAQNNIRRFIVAQYDERPKIVYNQDKWVTATNYQQYALTDLIDLWYRLNKHICHVLTFMPNEMNRRQVETEQLHDLRWLAEDYIRHLLHHLHQVSDLEPIAYP